jgi:hypothetical protein
MGSGKKSNGKRRVSKADGTKKRAKKAMRKSRRVDGRQMTDAAPYTTPGAGFERLQGKIIFTDGKEITVDKTIKGGTAAEELKALVAEARAEQARITPPRPPYDWQKILHWLLSWISQ